MGERVDICGLLLLSQNIAGADFNLPLHFAGIHLSA
jgi:hypothetical protein